MLGTVKKNFVAKKHKALTYRVRTHDLAQVEFNFKMAPHKFEKGIVKKLNTHIYFFLPQNLGISQLSYPIEEFHKNFINFTRLNSDLNDHVKNQKIYLPFFEDYLKQKCHFELVVQEFKFLTAAIADEIINIANRIDNLRSEDHENEYENIAERITNIYEIIKQFRQLTSDNLVQIKSDDLLDCISFTDEFISTRLRTSIAKRYKNYSESLYNKSLASIIEDILGQENQYAKSRFEFSFISANSTVKEKEYYFYRLSVLKKYIYEVLHLKSAKEKTENTFKNIIGMIGAALAALWATMAEIQRIRMISNQDTNFSYIPLFVIAVLAYVFKDRIKDLSKDWLKNNLRTKLPDYKTKLHYSLFIPANSQSYKKNFHIGQFKERLNYQNNEHVPQEVLNIRYFTNSSRKEPLKKENIFHYHKEINLKLPKDKSLAYKLSSMNDIIRLDIRDFLGRLDDHKKLLRHYQSEGEYQKLTVPRVYHLNLVLQTEITYKDRLGKTQTDTLTERRRLVLNKKGIVRVESVKTRP